MTDEFDRILSDDEILPSSGFTASVMEAVRREAAAPPPIPFPWKRALPGVIAVAITLVSTFVLVAFRLFSNDSQPAPVFTTSLLQTVAQFQLHWIVAALLITFVSLRFSAFLGSPKK